MLPADMKKTHDVAKLRILVEEVICRFKTFQIISRQVPITLLNSLNDIIIICAALCNIYKTL